MRSDQPGTLIIEFSYGSNTQGEGGWRLFVKDPVSGTSVVSAELSYEDFARMVGTNDGQVEVQGQIVTANADRWGKQYETRTLTIPELTMDRWDDRHAIIDATIAAQPDDGWFRTERVDSDGSTASTGWNGHRSTKDGYKVNIGRYVPIPDPLEGVEEIGDES